MTDYKITREQCQANISGVCSGCGGELQPIETVDNANAPTFWPGCLHCSRFNYGVPENVFATARKLVEVYHLKPYKHIDEKEHQYRERQTDGAVGIVLDVLAAAKETGLLPSEDPSRE